MQKVYVFTKKEAIIGIYLTAESCLKGVENYLNYTCEEAKMFGNSSDLEEAEKDLKTVMEFFNKHINTRGIGSGMFTKGYGVECYPLE